MNLINPVERFASKLSLVQNPASYIGGEIGAIVKPHKNDAGLFNFAIAFPDIYSIGMSNQAVKIIYQGLNKMEHVRCERVFCPDTDFEALLKKTDTPLYTLETGMPLDELDMIGFSIGYELGITGVLSILDSGRIPLLKKDRSEKDPIVIAGGVGATNPAVFSVFFDAVFIGEAEGGMFQLIEKLAVMKKNGADRCEILNELKKCPNVWSEDMSEETCGHSVAARAVYSGFAGDEVLNSFLPLANIKTVQDHGVVEIMRGCPNGCRFCHAGVYYRPQRARSHKTVLDYCEKLVDEGGFNQISLTSLSSADYPDIAGLLSALNKKFNSRNVSFQLPSLKVNSFTLPLLEQLSEVRKSGLTFAVETPEESWQLRLNKEVYAQHLVELINEAKKRGWNKAKFYFMVGLPFPENYDKTEEKVIVEFMSELQKRTGIVCHVNVGTFIPKPHTPYQWVRQISPEESEKKLRYIREHLPRGKFKVSTHDVATSFIEGLVSRGDKRAGNIIYSAYMKGARLNAWEENLRRDLPLWEEAFCEAGYDVKKEILRERGKDEILPWDSVSLGVSKNFYLKEWGKSENEILTPPCEKDCAHPCGVCNKNYSCNVDKNRQLLKNSEQFFEKNEDDFESTLDRRKEINIPVVFRAVFKFSKLNGGQFFSHLATAEMFNRAFQKAGLPVIYSAGFNPLPRLEFASTLSLGIESLDEYASVVLYDEVEKFSFMESVNRELVRGIKIEDAFIFPVTNQRRRESLSAGLWGNEYVYTFTDGFASKLEDFFKTDGGKSFLNPDSLCSFKVCGNKLNATLVFQKDRAFRNALESFFNLKMFEIASILKIRSLAKPQIVGWTDELNSEYARKITSDGLSKANETLKSKVLQPEQNTAGTESVGYFDLYKKIALVNKKLIAQRAYTKI